MATQWSLLDRILAYDRRFMDRAGDGVVVGIIYQGAYRPSRFARDEVMTAEAGLNGRVMTGSGVRVVAIELSSMETLHAQCTGESVDILYVAPLRAVDVGSIARMASDLEVPTFTGVREYVDDGLAVGVGQRGGRPEILINLSAARAQGMDFDSQFLRLVTVITEAGPTESARHPAPTPDRR